MLNEDAKQDAELVKNEDLKKQEEYLENAPPQLKAMMMRVSSFSSGSMPNPLTEKMNEEHIHKIIDNDEKEEHRKFILELVSTGRNIVFIILFFFLIWFLAHYFGNSKGMFMQLLTPLATFFAGCFGGYGIGSKVKKQD